MKQKNFLISVFIILSLLFSGCADENPIVIDDDNDEEVIEEPKTPKTYSVQIRDNNADMPQGGGVITSQFDDFPTGFDVSKLVDKKAETKFILPHKTFYIIWACNTSSTVNQYTLTSADDSNENDPKSWKLSGSNDKTNWTQLDEKSNQIFESRGQVKEIAIENENKYKYYKLDITSNNGGSSTQLAEWSMCIYSKTVDDISIRPQYSFYAPSSGIENIIDDNPGTAYSTPYSSFYVQYSFKKDTYINYYSLTSAATEPNSDPKSWILYGSVNNQFWVKLDEQDNQIFSERGEKKEFSFDNESEFRYFKLEVTSNQGSQSTQIAEWTLEVVYSGIEDLMDRASGSSYSSQTPMGNHYAGRHKTTEADREWLLDASNEPPAPASASHLFNKEFPVKLYPYGKPSPADVNQHAIGNCGGVAALASMAYIYPNFVQSLITDNGDNTYTVKMFDPQGLPVLVKVSNKFLTGNGYSIDAASGKNNTATWSTVLEKAIMKYNVIYKVNPDIGGIGSEHVPPLFTGEGNSFAFSPGTLTARELARVANVCVDQGYFVVGGFNRADLPVDKSKTVTAHAYTIMFSPNPDALFIMRNPWGGNPDVDGTADGVLNIPDDGKIPPTIDFRITYPGIAVNFGDDKPNPYIPPTMNAAESKMRVASYLLNPQPLN